MFEKRVSQSERRIRNGHVTSMRTGTPLDSNSNCQLYRLALESAHTPKAHDNRSELRKICHCADSAMPRNPAKDSRPSFRVGAREGLGTRLSCGRPGATSLSTLCTVGESVLGSLYLVLLCP